MRRNWLGIKRLFRNQGEVDGRQWFASGPTRNPCEEFGMKRFAFFSAMLLAVVFATTAMAQEEDSADWATTVKIGGFIDVRPTFYWFSPDTEVSIPDFQTSDSFHSSDVSLYETGINVDAKPFDAVRGHVTVVYREGPMDYVSQIHDLGDNAEGALMFDEGYVQLGSGNSVWLRAGKYYAPISTKDTFGFNYNLLQRNLFTNPVAVGFGYNHKFAGFSGHLWNGQADSVSSSGRPDNDIIDTYAFEVHVLPLAFQETHSINLTGYLLTDFAETWGDLGRYLAGPLSQNIMLYGGYGIGRFFLTDLIGIGVRGEYAATQQFEKEDYVNAAGDETSISFVNAELALLFWEGVVKLGGKYESINGVDHFGMAGPESEPTMYRRYGGFFRSNLMEELSLGVEYLLGSDDENNSDTELQVQARLDF